MKKKIPLELKNTHILLICKSESTDMCIFNVLQKNKKLTIDSF